MSENKAFDFIKLRELPPKPREISVIEIRGPYYTSVTVSYLKGLLALSRRNLLKMVLRR